MPYESIQVPRSQCDVSGCRPPALSGNVGVGSTWFCPTCGRRWQVVEHGVKSVRGKVWWEPISAPNPDRVEDLRADRKLHVIVWFLAPAIFAFLLVLLSSGSVVGALLSGLLLGLLVGVPYWFLVSVVWHVNR